MTQEQIDQLHAIEIGLVALQAQLEDFIAANTPAPAAVDPAAAGSAEAAAA